MTTKKQPRKINSEETIESKIYLIRGKKVMLDHDLAQLYGVTTGNLNLAVKRNSKRFPEDFMYQVTNKKFRALILQTAISKGRGGIRKLPYVFTENGIAMLSSVLNCDRAIRVNIQIMRTFTKLREILSTHKELKEKIEAMEMKYDQQFQIVFDAIKKLLEPQEKPKQKIGFHT